MFESLWGSLFGGNDVGANIQTPDFGSMGDMTGLSDIDLNSSLFEGLDTGALGGAINSNTIDANRALDPSAMNYGSLGGGDMMKNLMGGAKNLMPLMEGYNAWQMMNIMKSNEERNQQGFDLANERYDTNQASLNAAFAPQ